MLHDAQDVEHQAEQWFGQVPMFSLPVAEVPRIGEAVMQEFIDIRRRSAR